MSRWKRRNFTDEFKADAVQLVREGSRSFARVAKDLDLTEGSLREWVRQAEIEVGTGAADALTKAEPEELVRLRRENKRLEMARAIPKRRRRPSSRGRAREIRVHP